MARTVDRSRRGRGPRRSSRPARTTSLCSPICGEPKRPLLELRLDQQVRHRQQPAGRDVAALQVGDGVVDGPVGQPLVDLTVDLVGPVETLADDLEARVGQQLPQLHGHAQRLPLVRGDGNDRHPTVGALVEADGVRGLPEQVAPTPFDVAEVGVDRDGPLVEGGHGLHRPDVDELPLAGEQRIKQGGGGPDGADRSGQVRRPRSAALDRLAVGLARQIEMTARRPLRQGTVTPVAVRPGEAVAAQDEMDGSGVGRLDLVMPGQGGFGVPLEAGHDQIGPDQKPVELGVGQGPGHAALARRHVLPGRAAGLGIAFDTDPGADPTQSRSLRRLEADHVRAGGGQKPGAVAHRQRGADFQDPQPDHRQVATTTP
jgi:hypothetical protein